MTENDYSFDIPAHHKSIIKVVGVGGGGSNAVNHMHSLGIKDVEFVVCNTDSQALQSSPVPEKIQIGINLTGGLGAGANPEKGKNAAIESKEELKELLADTKMVFITAGMGGGTGTGAAPIIAQVAKELDILTVGIVTAPFGFEGKKKMKQANEGIRELRENCDTVIVILNDKIKEIYGNLPIREAFAEADSVLTTAAKGIAEIITVPGYVNVDFEDVKTVMKNAGAAVMGSAQTNGENRARKAAEEALTSPLLNNQTLTGAEKILLSIVSGEDAELQMDELTEITDYMQEFAGEDADVIFGHGIDPNLDNNIRVTVIATGFVSPDEAVLKVREADQPEPEVQEILIETDEEPEDIKTVFDLEASEGINQISLFGKDKEEVQRGDEIEFDFTESSLESDESHSSNDDESIDFDFDFPEKEEEKTEEEEFSFEFEQDFDIVDENAEEEEDHNLEELEDMAHPLSKKIQLMEARRKREEELAEKRPEQMISSESFKEKLDVPAYERKSVKLQDVPKSDQRNISKFNLTDDNQIIGNNRFLHDNVD